jgi:ketosteroid isomerase-like protein
MKYGMKILLQLFCIVLLTARVSAQNLNGSEDDRKSLEKATLAIREAFAKGDATLVAKLHHPDVVKYFGGNNVVTGNAAVEKGAADWFKNSKVEFIENTVESTIFNGETAIQTAIFSIKTTPKAGGDPVISRGRSMVVYVRDKSSPTGWLSVREMVQAAPDKKD